MQIGPVITRLKVRALEGCRVGTRQPDAVSFEDGGWPQAKKGRQPLEAGKAMVSLLEPP